MCRESIGGERRTVAVGPSRAPRPTAETVRGPRPRPTPGDCLLSVGPVLRVTRATRMTATAPTTRSIRATLFNRRPPIAAPTKKSLPSHSLLPGKIFPEHLTVGLPDPGLEWVHWCNRVPPRPRVNGRFPSETRALTRRHAPERPPTGAAPAECPGAPDEKPPQAVRSRDGASYPAPRRARTNGAGAGVVSGTRRAMVFRRNRTWRRNFGPDANRPDPPVRGGRDSAPETTPPETP
jgi:hypothetical protein